MRPHAYGFDLPDDQALLARIREAIARTASEPGEIRALAVGERLVLAGSIPAAEVPGLLLALVEIRGIGTLENRLTMR